MNSGTGLITASASLASVVGVALVAWQVFSSKAEQLMGFFAEYNERYNEVMADIPLSVLLDNSPKAFSEFNVSERDRIERAVFDYFQLCEEQLNIFSNARKMSGISHKKTWNSVKEEWMNGIKQNMCLDLFKVGFVDFRRRFESTKSQSMGRDVTQFSELTKFLDHEKL